MSKPVFDPERNVGTLIAEISHLQRRNFNRRARTFGLTQPQWRAITFLRRAEGVNQATMAEVLELQPISLARLIDRMEASGWVERRPDPSDRRAVKLFLTPKAQPFLMEMRSAARETYEQATAGLSAADCEQLLQHLGAIKTNLLNAESAVVQGTASSGK
jgi:DNA-binding MarR family transcriptional regulator